MFRKMRLGENQISAEEAVEILQKAPYGVLALDGDDNYPYALPVNFAYEDNKIYFHGATEGHKVDAVKRNEKVSFCAVAKADIVADKFNCLYLSAIAFGKVGIITNEKEKQHALELVIGKYCADFMEGGRKYIEASWKDVLAFVIEIDQLTGKMGTP